MITRARVQRERKFNHDVLDHREREDGEKEGKRVKQEEGGKRVDLIARPTIRRTRSWTADADRSLSMRPRPRRNLRFFGKLQRGSCDEEGSRENGESLPALPGRVFRRAL
jgi:hypothetical protein